MSGGAAPAWLAAWREGGCQPVRAAASPAQRDKRTRQGCSGGSATVSALAAAQRPKANWNGFIEPDLWPDDGGVRREPVLDADHNPPRVVRQVGWRRCIRCRSSFWSEDVQRLYMCDGCKGEGKP
jgi:hypothetical protein